MLDMSSVRHVIRYLHVFTQHQQSVILRYP